jgi:hypothetical protein
MGKRGSMSVILVLLFLVIAGLVALYFLFDLSENVKVMLLAGIGAVVLLIFIVLISHHMHGPTKIRRKLKEMESLVNQKPPELLKEKYVAIYNLYMKLSEKGKQNFYPRVTKIRETIEEQLVAEKRIEELLQQDGDVSQRQQNYQKVQEYFKKLPKQVQDRYYSSMIHMKEQLERGSSY